MPKMKSIILLFALLSIIVCSTEPTTEQKPLKQTYKLQDVENEGVKKSYDMIKAKLNLEEKRVRYEKIKAVQEIRADRQALISSKAEYEIEQETFNKKTNEYKKGLYKDWYNLYIQNKSIEVYEQALKNAVENFEFVKTKRRAESATEIDLMQAEKSSKTYESMIYAAKINYNNSLNDFLTKNGMDAGISIELSAPDTQKYEAVDIIADVETLISKKADIRKAKIEMELITDKIRSSEMFNINKLDLEIMKIGLEKQELEVARLMSNYKQNYKELISRIDISRNKKTLVEFESELSEKTYSAVRIKYKSGFETIASLNDELEKKTNLQLSKIKAEVEYQNALADYILFTKNN